MYLVFISVISIILMWVFIWLLHTTLSINAVLKLIYAKMSEFDDEEEVVSSYEEMRREREGEFDARINDLMMELGIKSVENTATEGQILHPDVYNIPHNSINVNADKNEEVAD